VKWNGFAQRGPCGDLVRLVAFGLLDLQRLGADRVGVGGVDEDRAVVVGEDVVVVADHRLAEPGGAGLATRSRRMSGLLCGPWHGGPSWAPEIRSSSSEGKRFGPINGILRESIDKAIRPPSR
jgi:hypothetical protein